MYEKQPSTSKPASNSFAYGATLRAFKGTLDVFFREIKTRGAFKVPKVGEGPVIFAAGPHNNLFVDGLVLASEVNSHTGRQVSFLVAERSMKQRFIGHAARLLKSIPVVRPKDSATPGQGRLYYSPTSTDEPTEIDPTTPDFTILKGRGTKFTMELAPRKSIMLSKAAGFALAEVIEVIDDETVRLRKEFGVVGKSALIEAGWGGEGVEYKVLPYIAQPEMYRAAFDRLREGGSIGIFPEGDTHDRPDFLPLKAGLAAMALGAMADSPGLDVRIVPVGLSFFHPDRFRSRAVVEFGEAISLPKELVGQYQRGGQQKRDAITQVMDLVFDGLRSVTARAPDYDTLMLIQAVRRLYTPPGQRLTLAQTVELNRRLISGYLKVQDQPKMVALKKRVIKYNTLLHQIGLKDHEVESATRPTLKSVLLLIRRLILLAGWGILAAPGFLLVAPMMVAARIISRKKAKLALAGSTVKIKGTDVLATWKVLTSLGMAPVLYVLYAGLSTFAAHHYGLSRNTKRWMPLWTMLGFPTVAYTSLLCGEVALDMYKSIRPLLSFLRPCDHGMVDRVRIERESLAKEITEMIEIFGPKTFDDWDQSRFIPGSVVDARPRVPMRKPTYPDLALFGISGRRSSDTLSLGIESGPPSRRPSVMLDVESFSVSPISPEDRRPSKSLTIDSGFGSRRPSMSSTISETISE